MKTNDKQDDVSTELTKVKRWRAFETPYELFDLLDGDLDRGRPIIVFREKETLKKYRALVCGHSDTELLLPGLGALSFQHLFDNFELFNGHCIWQPFGVEE